MNGTPACAGPAKQWLSTGACETGPTSPEGSARPAGRPTRFQHRAQAPRPSEPILIPKLRIQFADFPYLHYSIDQRLLTSETCCGYGYEPVRVRRISLSLIFKVPPPTHGSSENCWTLCLDQNPFSPRRNSRASAAYAEKTTLPGAGADVSGSIHVAVSSTRARIGSATGLRNKDLIPFQP